MPGTHATLQNSCVLQTAAGSSSGCQTRELGSKLAMAQRWCPLRACQQSPWVHIRVTLAAAKPPPISRPGHGTPCCMHPFIPMARFLCPGVRRPADTRDPVRHALRDSPPEPGRPRRSTGPVRIGPACAGPVKCSALRVLTLPRPRQLTC